MDSGSYDYSAGVGRKFSPCRIPDEVYEAFDIYKAGMKDRIKKYEDP
jgi:hypothetical protein